MIDIIRLVASIIPPLLAKQIFLTFIAVAGFAQQDIFSNVPLLQKALVPVLPAANWRDQNGAFTGGSQIRFPGPMGSVVSYAFMGKTATRVDVLSISTLIHSPADAGPAQTKLADATAQWFKSVGKAVPAGLLTAIRQSRVFDASANGLKVKCIKQGNDVIVRIEPHR